MRAIVSLSGWFVRDCWTKDSEVSMGVPVSPLHLSVHVNHDAQVRDRYAQVH